MRPLKIFLPLFLLILTTCDLAACLSASQRRIFPLGQTNQGLCVLEIHMSRSEFQDKPATETEVQRWNAGWNGISYFKIYDRQYNAVQTELIDTLAQFKETDYEVEIGKRFQIALNRASTFPDFHKAQPIDFGFCGFRGDCSTGSIYYEDGAQELGYQKKNSSQYCIELLYDQYALSERMMEYLRAYDTLKFSELKDRLFISSVREFSIGDQVLTVIHLGSGQQSEKVDGSVYPPGEEYEADFPFDKLEKSIFLEPVLHHGHGFDFFIWQ